MAGGRHKRASQNEAPTWGFGNEVSPRQKRGQGGSEQARPKGRAAGHTRPSAAGHRRRRQREHPCRGATQKSQGARAGLCRGRGRAWGTGTAHLRGPARHCQGPRGRSAHGKDKDGPSELRGNASAVRAFTSPVGVIPIRHPSGKSRCRRGDVEVLASKELACDKGRGRGGQYTTTHAQAELPGAARGTACPLTLKVTL